MFFSRLLRERFAGTAYTEHFLPGETEQTEPVANNAASHVTSNPRI
jgi:hypothetical protein